MADPRMMNVVTLNGLVPGSLFHPSDEQLISYYLASKNSNFVCLGTDLIKEVDLYMYEPFNLPEMACFQYQKGGKRKHWFCYVRRLDVDTQLRVAGNGFWKRRDAERNVIGGGIGRVVVGRRKTYVFYLWNDNNTAARKTEWLMYEYDLIGHPKADFVLCRVLMKPEPRKNISDRMGINVARVPHSELQQDGAGTSEGNEDNANDDIDDLYNLLFGQDSELENQDTSNPVAQQMEPATLAGMAVDRVVNQQLADIFKGELLE